MTCISASIITNVLLWWGCWWWGGCECREAGSLWEISVPSFQFFYKLKTALKTKEQNKKTLNLKKNTTWQYLNTILKVTQKSQLLLQYVKSLEVITPFFQVEEVNWKLVTFLRPIGKWNFQIKLPLQNLERWASSELPIPEEGATGAI